MGLKQPTISDRDLVLFKVLIGGNRKMQILKQKAEPHGELRVYVIGVDT